MEPNLGTNTEKLPAKQDSTGNLIALVQQRIPAWDRLSYESQNIRRKQKEEVIAISFAGPIGHVTEEILGEG